MNVDFAGARRSPRSMSARAVLLAAGLLLAGCQTPKSKPPPPPPPLFPAGWTLVDLTRPLDGDAPYSDHEKAYPFEHVPVKRTETREWRTGKFSGLEHQGTHVSSAGTRSDESPSISDLSADDLVAEAVVLDTTAPETDAAHLVTSADVEAHERHWGKIPSGAVVILRRPGIDAAALELLVSRNVAAVGTNAPNLDAREEGAGDVEQAAHAAGLWLLLNLRTEGMAALPERGARLLAAPLPISGAAGAPARVIAFVPPKSRLPKPVPRPTTQKAR